MKRKKDIYFFIPLASVGGTESVHADVLSALSLFSPYLYIRYSSNIWKGRDYAGSIEAKVLGKAMLPNFTKFAKVQFIDKYLEAPRFGRIIRKLFINQLAKKINRCNSPILIFWHRESIEFILPYLQPHVKIVDIVHNNSNNELPDATYLVNDLVPQINCRVLVSNGLKKWLEPLYKESNYSSELWDRIRVIEHCVHLPSDGFIQKTTEIFHVLFVGRDSVEKRFHLVLEIAKKHHKNFHFHFVGPEKDTYKNFKIENVTWYGTLTNRNEIEEIYRKSHVLIMTSSSEGFPKVISEAMAFSCVPLVTNVGDISSHIISNVNGILTLAENCVDESIIALQRLFNNKESFNRLSENSYFYAQEKFAEERFNNEWNNVVRSLS